MITLFLDHSNSCLTLIYFMLVADFVNDKRLSHVPGPNHVTFPIKDKT